MLTEISSLAALEQAEILHQLYMKLAKNSE